MFLIWSGPSGSGKTHKIQQIEGCRVEKFDTRGCLKTRFNIISLSQYQKMIISDTENFLKIQEEIMEERYRIFKRYMGETYEHERNRVVFDRGLFDNLVYLHDYNIRIQSKLSLIEHTNSRLQILHIMNNLLARAYNLIIKLNSVSYHFICKPHPDNFKDGDSFRDISFEDSLRLFNLYIYMADTHGISYQILERGNEDLEILPEPTNEFMKIHDALRDEIDMRKDIERKRRFNIE